MRIGIKVTLVFLIIISFIVGLYSYMNATDFLIPDGNNFCEKKGFDHVSWTGIYSEKYGKVKCVSCYDFKCMYEEFNVTKKFGIIKEDYINWTGFKDVLVKDGEIHYVNSLEDGKK